MAKKRKQRQKKMFKAKFFTRISLNVLLLPLLALFSVAIHYLAQARLDEGEVYHWFSIAISVVAFIFGGIYTGIYDFKTTHWSVESYGYRSWMFDPVAKTRKEVRAFVRKNFKKNNYGLIDLILVLAFLILDLVVLRIGLYYSPYVINVLVAFPVWVIAALIARVPTASNYIREQLGDDWKKYVCPHCRGICSPQAYQTKNYRESNWIGARQANVSSKHTIGLDTVWVDRTETQYTLNQNTSYNKVYTCHRCNKTFTKRFSYTSVS